MQVEKQESEDWRSRIGIIRRLQDEDGSVQAKVSDWNIDENEEFVDIEFEIEELGEVYTERFRAPSPSDDETLLEELVDELGYDIFTMNMIRSDKPQVRVLPVEDGEWSIKEWLRQSDTSDSTDAESVPSWAVSERDDRMAFSIVSSLVLGFISGPLIAVAIYNDELNSGFTKKSIAASFFCSLLNVAVLFFLIGLYI